MTDTAQPVAAADPAVMTGDPIAAAAAAFRAQREPEPAPKPRDEAGRFASPEPEIEQDTEIEAEEPDYAEPEAEIDAEPIEADEAAEEAQPEPVEMPASWSKDDAELWASLPPETQAKLAERIGQQEVGVNSKFQELATARKATEAQLAEANANRDAYGQAIDAVIGLIAVPEPNPVEYGLGTDGYDRDSYDIAVHNWKQSQAQVQSLLQQRQAIAAQQSQEEERARQTAFNEVEQAAWPKFVETVPELADPAKGRQVIADIVQYAVAEGLSQEAFRAGVVNSHEMRLLWKAREYDRIKSAQQRVKAAKPAPKPATPAVRPGTPQPSGGRKAAEFQKSMNRLAKSGSIEDGAAIFKHFR